MKTATYYRVWVPLSIVAHLIVLYLLGLVPMSTSPAIAEAITPVQIVADVEPPAPITADMPVQAIPPRQIRNTATQPGLPRAEKTSGGSTSPIKNLMPGPGEKPTAPPKIMRAPNGQWEAPDGVEGGIGTQGTELGPSGPSYGAASLGGPNPGYPKLAQERGAEGTAVLQVSISPEGGIESVSFAQRTGDRDLDDAALRAARAWQFKPAMQNGKPTGGSVKLRFTFANGSVSASVL